MLASISQDQERSGVDQGRLLREQHIQGPASGLDVGAYFGLVGRAPIGGHFLEGLGLFQLDQESAEPLS
jgi:hypothetical protein